MGNIIKTKPKQVNTKTHGKSFLQESDCKKRLLINRRVEQGNSCSKKIIAIIIIFLSFAKPSKKAFK